MGLESMLTDPLPADLHTSCCSKRIARNSRLISRMSAPGRFVRPREPGTISTRPQPPASCSPRSSKSGSWPWADGHQRNSVTRLVGTQQRAGQPAAEVRTVPLRQSHVVPGGVPSDLCVGRHFIPMIIQAIRLHPSRSVWIDEASNVSRPDPTSSVQFDAEHPARNRNVGEANSRSLAWSWGYEDSAQVGARVVPGDAASEAHDAGGGRGCPPMHNRPRRRSWLRRRGRRLLLSGGGRRAERCAARPCGIPSSLTSSSS
jgi:hypothetical protein